MRHYVGFGKSGHIYEKYMDFHYYKVRYKIIPKVFFEFDFDGEDR